MCGIKLILAPRGDQRIQPEAQDLITLISAPVKAIVIIGHGLAQSLSPSAVTFNSVTPAGPGNRKQQFQCGLFTFVCPGLPSDLF